MYSTTKSSVPYPYVLMVVGLPGLEPNEPVSEVVIPTFGFTVVH